MYGLSWNENPLDLGVETSEARIYIICKEKQYIWQHCKTRPLNNSITGSAIMPGARTMADFTVISRLTGW